MRRAAFAVAVLLTLVGHITCGSPSSSRGARSGLDRATRERAHRLNNLGVARLEQLKFTEAAAAFRDALSVDASLASARFNLSLALLYAQDLEGADREAAEAARLLPDAPQPVYVRGLVARAQNRNDQARALFERVRSIDPRDAGACVNVAQIALEEGRYDEAIAALRPIVADEPYHVTAAYVLGLALSRSGQSEEGQRLLARVQALRQTGYGVTFGNGYSEQGRHAEAIASTGAEPDLTDSSIPATRFNPVVIERDDDQGAGAAPAPALLTRAQLDPAGARALTASLGGGIALIDIDSDGDLDLAVISATGQRLLRNDRGSWTDVTVGSGLERSPSDSVGIGAVAADYDNDGFTDLFVMRYGTSSLYRNDGRGHFTDVTRAARLPAYPWLPGAAAFVDVDHDGDADLVIAGLADLDATRRASRSGSGTGVGRVVPAELAGAPLRLLRNNRDGSFTDITRQAGLDGVGHAVAIIPVDYDNHRDIDLLIVDRVGAPRLWANQRDGTFRDVADRVGLAALRAAAPAGGTVALSGDLTTVATGDFNKDDVPDFFFGGDGRGVLAESDARGRFELRPAPAGTESALASQIVDYDRDGLLDLIVATPQGLRVFRRVGSSFQDVSAEAVTGDSQAGAGNALSSSRNLVVADVDKDGLEDVVSRGVRGLTMWRARDDDVGRRSSLVVDLRGLVSNRLGIGAKVQVRAGSLIGRLDVSSATPAVTPADLVFGLGDREGADAVRVLWPSGILQSEAAEPAGSGATPTLRSPFHVEELDRKPSSCPFLFTWNGERFEFVTDFLGGGEMGDWVSAGTFNRPDPVEYVRIRGNQLRPRDGRFDIRVTNELEEVLYLDRVQLFVVDHPPGTDVFPTEGMTDPPKPFRLEAIRGAHPPAAVVDEHGHDVTDRVARLDWMTVDDFALAPIRGYAGTHSLTFSFEGANGGAAVLLTGWTDYAFSSDNVAASQAGLTSSPPHLEVKTTSGVWRAVDIDVGLPVGRPQTIALDLSGRLRPGERELRLTTNMRVYWDQVLVGTTTTAGSRPSTMVLEPSMATLRERGFSAEVRAGAAGPILYDYAKVSSVSPWKSFSGRFTRPGDARALLASSDDQFVIARSGDEIALSFDARDLKPPADDWSRTYLLRADGFSKEMDINSASPHAVEPLPFHAMSQYPYPPSEHYPDTDAHRQYLERYNTRVVTKGLPLLASPAEP
jgi:tetratricopeptide (TPR) repeat protein